MDNISGLARNFDKLDPVFQGYIFASKFPDRANRDESFRYCLDRISNNRLLELAEEIVRTRSRSHGLPA
ncbi:MAG: hypothetical protein EON58_00450 [Alphaproteobacteria bacterium]|nr:MAG: hypothetical protein EON58_00450 [Alphaproteobacteria bacterium]